MATNRLSCKACNESDPTQDIVKAAAERVRRKEAARRKAEEEDAALCSRSLTAQEDRWCRRLAGEWARLARKEAKDKVNAWCKSNGFHDMNTQKKTLRGATKFPLHTAVKNSNEAIIGMMLIAGVNKDVQDSKNQTPSELAAKLNKYGSHSQILTMLL